jgi:hypothetical protein
MVTLVQHRYGLGGAGGSAVVLVVVLVVAGGDGELMGTLGGKF